MNIPCEQTRINIQHDVYPVYNAYVIDLLYIYIVDVS